MSHSRLILVVDDEPGVLDVAQMYLAREGFRVTLAADGLAALAAAEREEPDLIILDLMLPGLDGFEVCRRLRRASDVPIIMLTARDEDVDKIVGLELGADDYITKPFDFSELEARCRAVLRRRGGSAKNEITLGAALFDPMAGTLRHGDERFDLRNRELRLLEVFARYPGQILSKSQLLDRLFSADTDVTENAIEVYVGRLRRKLDGAGVRIETVRGLGYRMSL